MTNLVINQMDNYLLELEQLYGVEHKEAALFVIQKIVAAQLKATLIITQNLTSFERFNIIGAVENLTDMLNWILDNVDFSDTEEKINGKRES